MRVLITVGLIATLTACGSSPSQEPNRPTDVAENADQEATSKSEVGPSSSRDGVSQPVPGADPMDPAILSSEIGNIFAQNEALNESQRSSLTASSMELIDASNSGDDASVAAASANLLYQATTFGTFGGVDAAGLAQAIVDLVAAAINADVAGILAAVQNIVNAVI